MTLMEVSTPAFAPVPPHGAQTGEQAVCGRTAFNSLVALCMRTIGVPR